jgi:hypothetical protein
MKLQIDININRRNDAVVESLEKLYSLLKTIKNTMATKEQLTAAFDRIQAAQADIAGDIRSLKDQLESAGVDQALVDRAEAIATSLEGLAGENPEQPTEPIEPADPTQPIEPDSGTAPDRA